MMDIPDFSDLERKPYYEVETVGAGWGYACDIDFYYEHELAAGGSAAPRLDLPGVLHPRPPLGPEWRCVPYLGLAPRSGPGSGHRRGSPRSLRSRLTPRVPGDRLPHRRETVLPVRRSPGRARAGAFACMRRESMTRDSIFAHGAVIVPDFVHPGPRRTASCCASARRPG